MAMTTIIAARGRKPAWDATTGRARIPAPMIVELKRKSPFEVEIDCDMVRFYLPNLQSRHASGIEDFKRRSWQ